MPVWVWWCLRAVLMSSTVGGCAVWLVPWLSVGWLAVRPFVGCGGCDAVKMWLLCPLSAFVPFVSFVLAFLGRSLGVPCRVRWWGGVFARPLVFVAVWGVWWLCSAFALAFGLWGLPRPYFWASEWGSDYPLKISEKNFSPMWCVRARGGFVEI